VVRTNAHDEGSTLGMPSPATFLRLVELPAGGGQAGMERTIGAARAAGWSMGAPIGDLGMVGEKRLPTGKATISIGLLSDYQATAVNLRSPVLSIGLEHIR
jgi:hypothetical protein